MNAVNLIVVIRCCAYHYPKAIVACILLLLSWLSMPVYAQALSVINGEKTTALSLNELRQQSTITLSIFDPFQGREVDMHGLEFRRFLINQFGEVPPALHFTTWDDYEVTLGGWDDPKWLMVTEEDGELLTLRSRGPLRLVDQAYNDQRDIKNLREFNDWIWMIRSIEARW
ncbi:hypothetical protein J4377_10090 [Halomonas sp. XH26]|uniref:hypothetical protein n=1 Tax=Halomonadaceae TaxID=28256 RepID=UPI000EA0AB4B|nr:MULTISPECIES: hypothetical protein [Halomonas]AYF34914.1 hypothetical protein CUU95_14295 [Halomonas alkaliphila]UTA78335.1 hypothetical protein J4377_10090 [Halomonas sp. XH26]